MSLFIVKTFCFVKHSRIITQRNSIVSGYWMYLFVFLLVTSVPAGSVNKACLIDVMKCLGC